VERLIRILPVVLVLLFVGCHEKQRLACTPPLRMEELAAGLPTPVNNFALLVDQPTEGRFACVLAIAKLIPAGNDAAEPLLFVPLRSNEQAYWTEQMRGVAAIQKLVFLRPRSTRPEGQSLPTLCATAVRCGAPLLLVYAASQVGPNSAQVLGVLYDAHVQSPLATIQASSRMLDHEGDEVSPGDKRGDHREQDAGYQTQRHFESNALACLRELIHRDSPAATTQPNKWGQPFMERWWIENRNR
jgi:hypothetical protein